MVEIVYRSGHTTYPRLDAHVEQNRALDPRDQEVGARVLRLRVSRTQVRTVFFTPVKRSKRTAR